ncbi:MAG: T9SS type A sorting domain-containing protein [Saprospiraceae bacterium]|nr:T9SS type A sorting domain-containing protein [Candidatus Vicinibacter affinis]
MLYIIKLLPNGVVDSTFGINGILNFKDCIGCRVIRIGVLSNNKIILAGTHDSKYFFLYQLNPDGSPDLKFGPSGKFEIGFNNQLSDLTEMIIAKNDQIFLAGTSNRDFAIVKILPSLILGVIDKSVKEKIINIYPNPVHNDLFSVDYELSFDQVISIALYKTNGQLVKLLINGEKRFSGKQLEQFEFPKGFANGTYILEIKSKEGMSSKTLILMNNF